MPGGSIGIGFTYFGGRGRLSGGSKYPKQLHFDGLECFNIFLPFYPTHAVHVWNYRIVKSEGSFAKRETTYSYRAIPIAWSLELVLRTMLRFWTWVPIWLTGLLSASLAHGFVAKIVALLMLCATVAGYLYLRKLDRRDRSIRNLLGKHRLGYSDPAHWTDELKQFVATPNEWFDEGSFLGAGEKFLQQQDFQNAMWAARLSVAFENKPLGEELTNRIIESIGSDQKSTPQASLPKFNFRQDEAGKFWAKKYEGKSPVRYTEIMFANNIFGSFAAVTDQERPGDQKELDQYFEIFRPDAERKPLQLLGIGTAVGTILLCFLFAGFANLFMKGNQPNPVNPVNNNRQVKQNDRKPAEVREPEIPMPKRPMGPSGRWVYLADLPFYQAEQGPWKITNDGTTGAFGNVPISIEGTKSPKGIGMHPPKQGAASVKFAVGNQASVFQATAAMNDTADQIREHAVFEVWGDDELLWQSEEMNQASQTSTIELEIPNIEVLELRVIAPGDYWSLHAVWVEPRIRIK